MGSTVALALNFVFVGILIVGFLIGLWRGLKKSAVNLAFSIAGVLLAFFITPSITNATLTFNVTINGTRQTISDFIINQFAANTDIAHMMAVNENFATLVNHLPSAIVSTLVFILLTLIIEFFIYIIYKIIAVLCLKNKPGKKRHRLLGGAVGVVKAFVISIFMFMPLTSLLGLVNDVNSTEDIFTQTVVAEEYVGEEENEGLIDRFIANKEVTKQIKDVEKNVFSIIGGAAGVDDAMFDYLSSFKMGKETVKIRQELKTYAQTANVILQLKSELSGNRTRKFSSIDFDKLEKHFNKVLESKIYSKVVIEIVGDVVLNTDDYSFASGLKEFEDILKDIRNGLGQIENANEYFSNDIKKVFSAFKSLSKDGVIDEVLAVTVPEERASKTEKMLKQIIVMTNAGNIDSSATAINEIFTTNIVSNSKVSISKFLTDKVMQGKNFVDISKVDGLDAWKKELKYYGQIAVELEKENAEGKNLLDTILESEDPAKEIFEAKNVNIENIVKPILYAKSTVGIRDMLFEEINAVAKDLGVSDSNLSPSDFVFEEGAENDQAQEICDIIVSLIDLGREIDKIGNFDSIADIDAEVVGQVIYNVLENEAFGDIVDAVADKVVAAIPEDYEGEYKAQIDQIKDKGLVEFIKTEDVKIEEFVDMFKDYFNQNTNEG